jgi:lysine-N-methylase
VISLISIFPVFFPQFRCKADQCKKTCCQTWEIDVDEETEKKYSRMPGPLGEAVRAALSRENGFCHFRLNQEGYCPLLTRGLCRIVLEAGDEYLCQICAMHPRFYKYIGDYELSGVGLCCEKSCELLAAEKGNDLLFSWSESDRQLTMHDILTLLGVSVPSSFFHFIPRPDEGWYQQILAHYEATEPIDETWTRRLERLKENWPLTVKRAASYAKTCDTALFSRLYQYILYRQLDEALTYSLESVMAYAREAAEFIYMDTAAGEDPLRAMADWSEQTEYDTDNVSRLLTWMESHPEEADNALYNGI